MVPEPVPRVEAAEGSAETDASLHRGGDEDNPGDVRQVRRYGEVWRGEREAGKGVRARHAVYGPPHRRRRAASAGAREGWKDFSDDSKNGRSGLGSHPPISS